MRARDWAAARSRHLLSLMVMVVGSLTGVRSASAEGDGLHVGSLKVDARLGTQVGFNSNVHANNLGDSSVAQLNIRPSLSVSTPAVGLMQLNGVLGVRVKIAKLEIFEDCEVAIRMETGQW